MFSYLRFIHATDAELMMLQATPGELKLDNIEPLSARLESVVLQHVQRAARAALAAFDTTLEQDNALLAANKFPNSNVRNCVLQRRGEKQVLTWWDNLATKCLPLLDMKW